MSFIRRFEQLLESNVNKGFIALVRPLSFEEEVEIVRRYRDILDEDADNFVYEDILVVPPSTYVYASEPNTKAWKRYHLRMKPRHCAICRQLGHNMRTCKQKNEVA